MRGQWWVFGGRDGRSGQAVVQQSAKASPFHASSLSSLSRRGRRGHGFSPTKPELSRVSRCRVSPKDRE